MSRIERGRANPSLDAIETLATGLKVALRELFDEYAALGTRARRGPA